MKFQERMVSMRIANGDLLLSRASRMRTRREDVFIIWDNMNDSRAWRSHLLADLIRDARQSVGLRDTHDVRRALLSYTGHYILLRLLWGTNSYPLSYHSYHEERERARIQYEGIGGGRPRYLFTPDYCARHNNREPKTENAPLIEKEVRIWDMKNLHL